MRGEEVPYKQRGMPTQPLLPRLMAKIQKSTDPAGCWEWTGARITSSGYGRFAAGRVLGGPQTWMAHRVTYTVFVGPIPAGLDLDHLCRNRICVNPKHLEPVTRRVNTLRSPIARPAVNAQKMSCDSEHEFTPENTYVTSNGWRRCRTCHREAMRRARGAA
jgi:hypothetical protein